MGHTVLFILLVLFIRTFVYETNTKVYTNSRYQVINLKHIKHEKNEYILFIFMLEATTINLRRENRAKARIEQ